MTRKRVTSSNLRSVGYDPTCAVLQIEFHHGGIYNYYQVPWSVYAGLMEAGSKGRYHHEHIKKCYPYQRLDR
jgi:hypothetical protein